MSSSAASIYPGETILAQASCLITALGVAKRGIRSYKRNQPANFP